jgi:NitT/TauT family transport system substrate-binding protein
MTLTRRSFLTVSAALGAAGPHVLTSRARAQATPVLRYGVYPDIAPFVWVSRDWTGKYGVKMEFTWFGGGGDVDNALIAGQIDADSPGIGRVVSLAAAKPGEIAQLMVLAYGDYSSMLVAPGAPYKTMGDLKGKKVGAAVGSGAYMAWLVTLRANGLKPEDFQVVNIAAGSMAAGLSSGSLDAVVVWEPFPALMEEQKTGRIIQQFAKWVSDVALVQTLGSTLEKRRGDVVKMLAGLLDCQEFIRTKPKEAATIVSEGMAARGLQVPASAFEVVIRDRLKWTPDLADVEPSLKTISEVAQKLGAIKQAPVLKPRQDVLDEAKQLRART